MSNRQIEEVINNGLVELQERRNAEYEDALSHGILVQECSLEYRQDYIEWLRGAGSHHPRSHEILEAWSDHCNDLEDVMDDVVSQEERKQSMRTTGA